MSTPKVQDVLPEFVDAMASMAELMSAMGEAVDGCRSDATRRGYSPTVAEQMAVAYHQYLLTVLVSHSGVK